jgi:hypothetical protein
MDYKHYHGRRKFRHYLSGPFIYAMAIPLVFLDIGLEIYHHVCFPLYGLPYVRRSSYIKIDRHRLAYLKLWDKVNCMFCGYANGLLRYASAIAAKTEQYWCGIKHQQDSSFIVPPHHAQFLEYGDEKQYKTYIQKVDEKS